MASFQGNFRLLGELIRGKVFITLPSFALSRITWDEGVLRWRQKGRVAAMSWKKVSSLWGMLQVMILTVFLVPRTFWVVGRFGRSILVCLTVSVSKNISELGRIVSETLIPRKATWEAFLSCMPGALTSMLGKCTDLNTFLGDSLYALLEWLPKNV